MSKYRVNAGEYGQKEHAEFERACLAALLYIESGIVAEVERPAGRGGKGWTPVPNWLARFLASKAHEKQKDSLPSSMLPPPPEMPGKVEIPRPGKMPGMVKAGTRKRGTEPSEMPRIPWSEREYRVLSNPHATPKMHETLESAIGAGKRHIEAGRVPVIERLIDGKWLPVVGWEQSAVSPKTAMRW